ncbi:F-box-like protein [Ceratobasidium sp. AG-Ba]|nr:F-box-like protein [Ceratobasidium sp. AG-Ba]
MDTRYFPDEILLDIVHYVGCCSSHDLRGIALVSRRWYLVAAPELLSTVRVTSLGDLVRLCDHLAEAHVAQNFLLGHPISNSNNYVSMIEYHTRSISINGRDWPPEIGVVGDYHTGLDEYQPPGGSSLITAPDIQIKYRDMLSKLGAAIPHLKQLESLEWYGRFPGDYYLVNYLLQTRVLSRLILGIDNHYVRIPQSYCSIATGFKRLKEFSIETKSEYHLEALKSSVINVLHRSPGLERIVLWAGETGLLLGSIRMSPTTPATLFVWPNLKHLEIGVLEDWFWNKLEDIELLTRFFCAHKQLQTLIIGCCEHSYHKTHLAAFSLGSYPDSLPKLTCLHASLHMIAGILGSVSACSALETIVDTGASPERAIHELFVETILERLERAPSCRLQTLSIGVAGIHYELLRRFAQVAPCIGVLELKPPKFGLIEESSSARGEPPSHVVVSS